MVVDSSADHHSNGLEKSIRLTSPAAKACRCSPMVLTVCPLSCAPKETASVVERPLRAKLSHGLSMTINWNSCRFHLRTLVQMASGGQACPITSSSVSVSRNSRVAASRSSGASSEVYTSLSGTRILPSLQVSCQDAFCYLTFASVPIVPRLNSAVSAPDAENPSRSATTIGEADRGGTVLSQADFGWTVKPSFPSTLTAPLLPPSKSPGWRRCLVANS